MTGAPPSADMRPRPSSHQPLIVLSALYVAQGLPFGFFVQALPVMMRQAGYSLIAIGATGML